MAGERPFTEVVKETSELQSAKITQDRLDLFRKLSCEYSTNLNTARRFNLPSKFNTSMVALKDAGFFADLEFSTSPKLIDNAKIPTVEGSGDYVLTLSWDTGADEKQNKIDVKVTKDAIILGGDKEPIKMRRLDLENLTEENLDHVLSEVFVYQMDGEPDPFDFIDQESLDFTNR